jgi:hypothetical protein
MALVDRGTCTRTRRRAPRPGKGHGGWGISTTPHSLSLFVGGISTKPAVVDGRIEPREMLDLTVVFDHEVIDGGPAARFVRSLVETIERGDGLPVSSAANPPGASG